MILRPIDPQSPASLRPEAALLAKMTKSLPAGDGFVPAWSVVAEKQGAEASRFLLVNQPDHAKLAGELAAAFRAGFLPKIGEEIARGIGVHDEGWAQFPCERDLQLEPSLNGGRPKSFLEVTVDESLAAWTGSIEAGAKVSPVGESMVSAHFSRIGRMRLSMNTDSEADRRKVDEFVEHEDARQKRLAQRIGLSDRELSAYVDLLQFCDVLSLYLCCGAIESVEFPQTFSGHKIRIRHEDGVYVSTPSLFAETQRFSLPLRLYPSGNGGAVTRIGIHVE